MTDREQLRRAFEEGADVVWHCAQPAQTRWPQEEALRTTLERYGARV